MQKVVVVVPIHSEVPTQNELISFEQCLKIFKNRPIIVVAPEGLSLAEYRNANSNFDTIFIDKKWQSSIANYNKLKISRYFYDLFINYEFLLTYELDCFVFRDDLDYWCAQGYDYIGAPWFEGFSSAQKEAVFSGVGNSGFSLRKISSVKKILKHIFYRNPDEYKSSKLNFIKSTIKSPYLWFLNHLGENYSLQRNCGIHEDSFYGRFIPSRYPSFNVAPVEEALKFSFEVNPRVLYEINKGQLPTGCHAWWRYDINFWLPHIQSFGYTVQAPK